MSNKRICSKALTRRRILKYGLYGGLALNLSPALWLGGCRSKQRGKKSKIILISVDTLRPDHLGCYGYHRNTSPNLDEFAQNAMVFENCLSHASQTRQSFASILSGFLPHETRVSDDRFPVPYELETLPVILRRNGYKTAAVMSNYVMRKTMGHEHGFMIYDDTMNERELIRRWPEKIAEHATNRTIELLKQFCKEQFFIWVHYQDPHGPYAPTGVFSTMFTDHNKGPRKIKLNASSSGRGGIPWYQRLGNNRDYHYYVSQYDGEIRYWDEHFKRLVDTLRDLRLYDDALIIFTSDHGEGMGEHNYYFAHGENLYNTLTHVPLIIKHGNELVGRRTDFVQHLDIVPTTLKVAGVKSDLRFRGQDLRNPDAPGREVFAEMVSLDIGEQKFSLFLDKLKLIYTHQTRQYELFDLNTDPHEERNLIGESAYREEFTDLRRRLWRMQKEDLLGLRPTNLPRELTGEEKEKLKSLGYVR